MDDDIYLNVANLVKVFPKPWKHFNQITGYLSNSEYPIRWALRYVGENYKYICPEWMYSKNVFPPFTRGWG